jgi:2-keto-3-deoxy-L-rhamnonate aldolase RhmA
LRRESISVHAKKNANGKWKITNDMGLTAQIFAPPTYDDVVADEEHAEPPPAYESLPCSVRTSCELGQS